MSADLFQSLQVVSHLAVKTVRKNLEGFSIHNVTLTIEEPVGNLELSWVLNNGDDTLQLVRVEFTGPKGQGR